MNADEKILNRLKELIEAGERVLATQHGPGEMVIGDDLVDTQLAYQWSTSVQSLLARVFGRDSEHYRNFVAQAGAHLTFSPVYHGQGILKAAKDDYENGHIFELRRLVEAEVFDDFLEQAQYLLDSGYHQAAAVVAGCVLEDGLRKLCAARGIAVPTHSKLDAMNADLAQTGQHIDQAIGSPLVTGVSLGSQLVCLTLVLDHVEQATARPLIAAVGPGSQFLNPALLRQHIGQAIGPLVAGLGPGSGRRRSG